MNKKDFLSITVLFICWRLCLFILAFLAPFFLIYEPSFPYAYTILAESKLPQFIYSFANFDGVHYLITADKGYFGGIGLVQAFFPLYPLLIRLINGFLKNPIITALLISNFCFLICLFLFYYLVKKEFNQKIAFISLLILILFPTSFYFVSVYNESLFLMFCLSSLILAKQKKWFWAAIFAALAANTRLIGIFLWPTLLIELYLSQKKSFNLKKAQFKQLINQVIFFVRQNFKQILIISLSTLGLLFYMLYLQYRFDDALYFFHVQSKFGAQRAESIILLPQVLWRYLKIFITARPIDLHYYAYLQEFILTILVFWLLILATNKISKSYLFYAWLSFLLPTLTGTLSSIPRYIIVVFPLFVYLALILNRKTRLLILYLTISLLFLIINTVLFIQGYWIA